MECFLPRPKQTEPAAPGMPVFFALDSAQYLRDEIGSVDTGSLSELTRLRHELAMLRYWLDHPEAVSTDYSALSAGLREFADRVETCLNR